MKKSAKPKQEDRVEAERFVDFARKLMAVPKEEIDEQQAIYEQEKQPGQKREPIIIEDS
jgi:hypothetical protein